MEVSPRGAPTAIRPIEMTSVAQVPRTGIVAKEMLAPKTPLQYPHGCNQTSCLREEQVITSAIMEACSQQMKKDVKQLKEYNGTGI